MAAKKTTKKPVKKSVSKTVSSSKAMKVEEKKPQSTTPSQSYKKYATRKNALILVGLVILGALIFFLRGFFVAATVNGQPITRIQIIQELEKQNGQKTLDSLVTKTLILQEMDKKNISVNDAEVQAEIKKIEGALKQQGRTMSDALAQQGLSQADLVEQLKIQKMIEKLFSKDIVVSDAEVNKYIEDNKDALPADQDPNTLKSTIKEQLKQQKLTAKFQTWLEGVQKKAKINYIVKY